MNPVKITLCLAVVAVSMTSTVARPNGQSDDQRPSAQRQLRPEDAGGDAGKQYGDHSGYGYGPLNPGCPECDH